MHFDRRDVETVFRSAAKIGQRTPLEAHEPLTVLEIIDAGVQAGLSATTMRQAVGELALGSSRDTPRFRLRSIACPRA